MSELQASNDGYEFTDAQNASIRELAGAMKFVAVVELILGILYGVLALFAFLGNSIGSGIAYGITCVITIALATMLSSASGYFKNIVNTRGADVMHLMGALDHLRKYFNLKRTLYIIAMILIALGIVLVILTMGRQTH
jgi:hypothetical protein